MSDAWLGIRWLQADMLGCVQIEDMNIGDKLDTAISENLTVGAAAAPPMAAPAANSTVVTVRSAQSLADIIAYNITACMVCIHDAHRRICMLALATCFCMPPKSVKVGSLPRFLAVTLLPTTTNPGMPCTQQPAEVA